MSETDEFAHKRNLLVEALATCAAVATQDHDITLDTLRSLFKSAMPEWWREGELKLEPVWKVLCSQPGVIPQSVAPPLLLLRSLETKLDVKVRLPDALSGIPPAEQQRLLDSISQETRDRVAAAIDTAKLDAARAQAEEVLAEKRISAQRISAQRISAQRISAQRISAQRPISTPEIPKEALVAVDLEKDEEAQLWRRKVAFTMLPLSVVAVILALFLSLRPTATLFDLSKHASILKLSDGKRETKSLVAKIADPKWNTSRKEAREKIVQALLEAVIADGINVLTLVDDNQQVRALGYLQNNKIQIVVR